MKNLVNHANTRNSSSLAELILVVTVDVEEDNWGLYRSDITVENVREITRLQGIFNRYGIKPTYLVDYQVALCDWAVDIISEIASIGKCEIGAHLHPWNTPPQTESLSARHSMLKNLPYELQVAKLRALTDQIEKVFRIKPQSFRAGRWGLGPETLEGLIACGYGIDTSIAPMMSWKTIDDGPIFSDMETDPYWITTENLMPQRSDNAILEIPVTIGFNRWSYKFWKKIYPRLQKDWLKPLHALGLIHHTRLLYKIWLSPEISAANDMITLSKLVTKQGKRVLNLTFHTPSLLPGKGPFIKNRRQLEQFYARLGKVLEHLNLTTNLLPLTLSETRQLFEANEDVPEYSVYGGNPAVLLKKIPKTPGKTI